MMIKGHIQKSHFSLKGHIFDRCIVYVFQPWTQGKLHLEKKLEKNAQYFLF